MGSVGVIPINFRPSDIIQYEWPVPNVIDTSVYYIPESSNESNQVAFDSFIVDDRVLYIFQFTIAPSPGIKAGIMDFLSQRLLQTTFQGKELRFVFIIPPGYKVECPEASDDRLEEFWNKVKLYSAVDQWTYSASNTPGADVESPAIRHLGEVVRTNHRE
jgi:hypothetical protein